MEDKDKIITELKAESETLKKVKDFACINLNNYIADNNKLKAENELLKEKFIQASEDLGNATVKNFTLENKLDDTESRLITLQKANTHNLVLLQRCKTCLQEIKEIALLGTNTYKEEKEPNSLSTWKNAQFEKIIALITKAESEG